MYLFMNSTSNRHNNDNNEEAEGLEDDFLLPKVES